MLLTVLQCTGQPPKQALFWPQILMGWGWQILACATLRGSCSELPSYTRGLLVILTPWLGRGTYRVTAMFQPGTNLGLMPCREFIRWDPSIAVTWASSSATASLCRWDPTMSSWRKTVLKLSFQKILFKKYLKNWSRHKICCIYSFFKYMFPGIY